VGIYFKGAKSDCAGALKYYQKAYSLTESIGFPTIVGISVLTSICNVLHATGKPLNALTHAQQAHNYAEHIGDIYYQAWCFYFQGICHTQLSNYWHAQHLLKKARHILATLGQQQSVLELDIINQQAEIHLLKSEYLESRKLQVTIASSCQPTSVIAIIANLNIAVIDIATGAESKNIWQNINMVQSHLKALYGYLARYTSLVADHVAAELCLRDGALGTVMAMFEKGFELCLALDTDLTLLRLERLGDLPIGMNDTQTTLRWTGIFLGLALKCKAKRQTIQAWPDFLCPR
jgi:hypothetical protein